MRFKNFRSRIFQVFLTFRKFLNLNIQANSAHGFSYNSGITAFCGLDVNQIYSNEAKSSLAGACLVDITHDNDPSTIVRHSVADCLPRAAICAFSNSTIGSSR